MITTSNFSICVFCHSARSEESQTMQNQRCLKAWPHARISLQRFAQHDNVAYSKIQRKFFWVFNAVLHFDEESNCFVAIDGQVIIAEREIHHRADFHFPVLRHWPGHDFVYY